MQMGQLWKYAAAGNIKKSHLDENGIERYGTLTFTGNTKVYLCGKIWNNERKEIAVLGLCRGKRYYVDRVPVDLIENVRMTKVYTPKVLEIMSNWECETDNEVENKDETTIIVFPEFVTLKAEVEKLRTEISMLLLERDELHLVIVMYSVQAPDIKVNRRKQEIPG